MDSNQQGRPNFQPNNYDLIFSRQPIGYFLNDYEKIEKMLYDDCISLFFAGLPRTAFPAGSNKFVCQEITYEVSIPEVVRRELHIFIDSTFYAFEKKKPKPLTQAIPRQIGRINNVIIYAPEKLLPAFEPILNRLCRQVISCYETLKLYFIGSFPSRSLISEAYRCINQKIQNEHKNKKLINCFGITLTEMVEQINGDNFCQYYFDKLTVGELLNILAQRKSLHSPFDTFLVINKSKAKDVIAHKLTDTDISFRTNFTEIVDPLYPTRLKEAESNFFADNKGFSSFYFGKADRYLITASYPLGFTEELVPLFTKLMDEIVELFESNIQAYGRLELRQAANIILAPEVPDAPLAIIDHGAVGRLKKIIDSLLYFENDFNLIITNNNFNLPL